MDPDRPKQVYGAARKPVTPEEYIQIKERYPDVKFNDDDMTFVSTKGNLCSAALLRKFKPIPKGNNPISNAGGQALRERAQDGYDKYIANLAKGLRISESCRRAGVSYNAIQKKRMSDPEFIKREKDAEQLASEPVENSLWDAAINGNVPAAVKWLEKRAPERWPSDKTIIETKSTLELDAGAHIQNIIALMAKLQQRAELHGEVIDVEAVEPNQLGPGEDY